MTFYREQDPYDTHVQLAHALWDTDSSANIEMLPDILTVYLAWQPHHKAELWKLDKELIMGQSKSRDSLELACADKTRSLHDGE